MRRLDAFWIACGGAFVAYVVYLSVTPDPVRAPTVEGFKTGHIVAYLWLMLWFSQVAKTAATRLVTALLLCALGVFLEYVQLGTGYRTFAYSDMADDALGVAAGWLLAGTRLGRIEERLSSLF